MQNDLENILQYIVLINIDTCSYSNNKKESYIYLDKQELIKQLSLINKNVSDIEDKYCSGYNFENYNHDKDRVFIYFDKSSVLYDMCENKFLTEKQILKIYNNLIIQLNNRLDNLRLV